jgi:NAD-dependent dihydropyrimidine dehydrogenase PreA subunit
MPHVVTEPCVGVMDKACAGVCPVDCFYEGTTQLYIHPDECIDCSACVPECPVSAIYAEPDVPTRWREYITANAALRSRPLPPAHRGVLPLRPVTAAAESDTPG